MTPPDNTSIYSRRPNPSNDDTLDISMKSKNIILPACVLGVLTISVVTDIVQADNIKEMVMLRQADQAKIVELTATIDELKTQLTRIESNGDTIQALMESLVEKSTE